MSPVLVTLIVAALLATVGTILVLVGFRDANNRLKEYGAVFGVVDIIFIFAVWPHGLGQLALVGGIIGAIVGFVAWLFWPSQDSTGDAATFDGTQTVPGSSVHAPDFTKPPDDKLSGPAGSAYGEYGKDNSGLG